MAALRFGLIGLGIHGTRYAHHISHDLPGVRLAAVCRRDPAQGQDSATQYGATYYPDFRSLIGSSEVDAVCAVVPPDLHPEIAEAAADAGVPLLLEKPLAVDLAGIERILRATVASPAPIMVAHTLRYNRTVLGVKKILAQLGPIHLVALNQRFEPAGRDWLDRPGPGGAILNTGIHEFDLLGFLTGCEVRSVRCRTRRVFTSQTEDVFAAVMDLEPGSVLATVDASRAAGGRSNRIEIAARDGQISGDHGLGKVRVLTGRAYKDLPDPEDIPTVCATLADFLRLLHGEIPNPIPPVEAARAVAIAVACHESAAAGGAPVTVESIEIPA